MNQELIHTTTLPARLIITQSPELNPLLDNYIPTHGPSYWSKFAGPLAISLLAFVPLIELMGVASWLGDKPILKGILPMSLVAVIFALSLVVTFEIGRRKQNRSSLQFEVCQKGLRFLGAVFLPWTGMKWYLAPMPGNATLRKLVMVFDASSFLRAQKRGTIQIRIPFLKPKKRIRRWSIILRYPEQTKALQSELQSLRESGEAVPSLREVSDVDLSQQNEGKKSMIGTICSLAAYCLCLHGFPLVIFGYAAAQASSPLAPVTRNERKLFQFLAQFFSTQHQLALTAFMLGSTMLVGALLFGAYNWILERRQLWQYETYPNPIS